MPSTRSRASRTSRNARAGSPGPEQASRGCRRPMSTDASRRRFVVQTAQGAAAASCVGLLWHVLLTQQARAATPLRPPGARAEGDFAASCAKCGLCVQACPYGTLKLATLGEAVLSGTPTFAPREIPCYMCVDIPCAQACPTGALDRTLKDINAA